MIKNYWVEEKLSLGLAVFLVEIESRSMTPTIDRDSVVIVERLDKKYNNYDKEELEDRVTYKNSNAIIVHRIKNVNIESSNVDKYIINERVSIYYDYFNDLANNFKPTYGVNSVQFTKLIIRDIIFSVNFIRRKNESKSN